MSENKEQKNMTGVLFKNDKRTEANNWPHYQGTITIDGKQYWLSAYVNKSESKGTSYMSLNVKERDGKQSATQSVGNDDLPF